MAAHKTVGQKRRTIDELVELQCRINDILLDLCTPCPKCCPPKGPCEPGELHDYGQGIIYACQRCGGKGYLLPDEN